MYKKNITNLGLLFAIVSTHFSANLPYVFLAMTAATCFLLNDYRVSMKTGNYYSSEDKALPKTKKSNIEAIAIAYLRQCWWILPLLWLYGFSIATILNVPLENSSRNFFGFLIYFLYPFIFNSSVRPITILSVICLAVLFLLFLAISSIFDMISIFKNLTTGESISHYRIFYNPLIFISFPIISVGLAKIIYPKQTFYIPKIPKHVGLLLSKSFVGVLIFVTVILSLSKGAFVILLILIFFIYLFSIVYSVINLRLTSSLFLLSCFFICLLYSIPQTFWDTLFFTFSSEESSNSIRAEQSRYLKQEFTFFGNGLGATLKSGYIRDNLGYGFELTYLNLIHKLGIFSIPLFISYFCLGLMYFLVQGAANPILLAPMSVILHCCALHILCFER